MAAITITDLDNAKLDVDHIAALVTSTGMTATDRIGGVKSTAWGAIQTLKAFNPRGAFAGATLYPLKDVYTDAGIAYVSVIEHTSTTVAADLAAGKVTVHQGATKAELETLEDRIGWKVASVFEFMSDAQIADCKTGTATIDVTAALQAAIDSGASALDFGAAPNVFLITGALDLRAQSIQLIGSGAGAGAPKIKGDFNGFLLNCSGVSPAYSPPYLISGLSLENLNNGTAAGSAGCVDIRQNGVSVIEKCAMRFNNTGVSVGAAISCVFRDNVLTGASGTNPVNSNCRGYYGFARNCRVLGGRVYGCFVCLDVSGDSWIFDGLNCEWSEIVLRTQSVASMLVIGCHFETSGCIWTNATVLPTTGAAPWTDNAGDGIGWTGAISFINTLVSTNGLSAQNGIRAPMFVIKSQASFGGALTITGCVFAVPDGMATISASFSSAAATGLLAGMRVFIAGTTGFIDPATIPNDVFTNYTKQDASFRISRAGIDVVTQDMSFGTDKKITAAMSIGFLSGAYADGTGSYAYTTSGIYSTFYGTGVQMTGGVSFAPTADNAYSLGSATMRWSTVYAATSAISTSDVNAKTDISASSLGLDFIMKLTPKCFRMKDSGNFTLGTSETYINSNGETSERIAPNSRVSIPGVRVHEGFLAQDVKAALDDLGIDRAMWSIGNDQQGLRYEEFIAPLVLAVQQLSAEFNAYKLAHP